MIRHELIKKVALKMDEISSSDDVIVSVETGDNNPLYTQINGLINESINEVLAKAPINRISTDQMLQSSGYTPDLVYSKYRTVAMIPMPIDFLRLVSIDDDKFQRPITELAVEGDEVSKRQHNRFLMAKSAKPVGVISMDGVSGGRVIKCYSYEKSQTPNPTMLYIKRFGEEIDEQIDIKLDDYLLDIVSWVCAGKVFASRGDLNNSKLCDDNAVALMV